MECKIHYFSNNFFTVVDNADISQVLVLQFDGHCFDGHFQQCMT